MTVFERLFATAKKPWFLLIYFILVMGSFFYIDKPLAYYFHHLASATDFYLLHALTRLGTNKAYLVGLLLLALFFRYLLPNKAAESRVLFLWLCVLASTLVCSVLKVFLGRARPQMLFEHKLYGLYGFTVDSAFWSLPSGHAITVMTFVFGLSVVFPKCSYWAILAGLIVVATRVILTNHFLSDVLVSSYLSVLIVGFLNEYLTRQQPKKALSIFCYWNR